VKNATTGSMKIYRNGTLWHSATGKTKPLDRIVRMRVGSRRERRQCHGPACSMG
jgi:hypothetical protein